MRLPGWDLVTQAAMAGRHRGEPFVVVEATACRGEVGELVVAAVPVCSAASRAAADRFVGEPSRHGDRVFRREVVDTRQAAAA